MPRLPAYRWILAVGALGATVGLSARADEPKKGGPLDAPPAGTAQAAAGGGIDGSAPNEDASSARLGQWVEQLGAVDYRDRELATQQLIAAGPEALDTLVAAAQTSDLEVSYRIVGILQSLLDTHDSNTERRVVAALEAMALNKASPVADLAGDVLSVFWIMQPDRAVQALRRLGAIVDPPDAGLAPVEVGFGNLDVTLGAQWRGTSADLIWLRRLPSLARLRVYVPLDEAGFDTLESLTQLSQLDLYGTDITKEQADHLAAALPGVDIDRRNGALLGVAAERMTNSNKIKTVHAGSAAAKADIREQDEIINFDGTDVQNFEQLTQLIGTKRPGERVTIKLRRSIQDEGKDPTPGGDFEILTKEVTLGRWQGGEYEK